MYIITNSSLCCFVIPVVSAINTVYIQISKIHTYIHAYIFTYIHTCTHIHRDVSVAEWLAWLAGNCGRIGTIDSNSSNGLKPNL